MRIFRLAYPDTDFVRLGIEALSDWHRLERDAGEKLVASTGGLDLGAEALQCAQAMSEQGVDSEVLEPSEVADRFFLKVAGDAVFTPSTGVIAAARTVEVQAELAVRAGARIWYETGLQTFVRRNDRVRVDLGAEAVTCRVLVLATGPWIGHHVDLPIFVSSEQVDYFEGPKIGPVLIDRDHPTRYLVPKMHGAPGIRVGLHHSGKPVDPEDGPFDPDDSLSARAKQWLAGVVGAPVREIMAETCLYTNAPNEDFILERRGQIVVVSACSGHGFKFAPRIGRAVADIVESKDPHLPGRLGAWWRPG